MSNRLFEIFGGIHAPFLPGPGGNSDDDYKGKIEDISGKKPVKSYTKADKTIARAAQLSVTFNNTDISSVVKKYLMSFSFTDNEEDEADDLQIKLEDRNGTWLQKWLQDFIEDSAGPHYVTKTTSSTVKINDTRAGIYNTVSAGTNSYEGAVCQAYLKALKFLMTDIKVKVGDDCVTAIKAFQQANKLSPTGKCDKATWKKLTAAAKGKTIPAYNYNFKAMSKLAIRKKTNTRAAKVCTMPKGKFGVVLSKKAKGWYRVKYDGKTGYLRASSLKLSSVDTTTKSKTGTKLKRTQITAKIKMPINGKLYTRNVGLFELDDVKASGPPSVVVIKGTSLAYNGIRSTKNDKSWTSTSLKKIAYQIAKSHGMGLLWDCKKDKKFTRVEQTDQTDIAFLKKICQDAGCALKITNNKIVIYDQSKYEELKSVATITFGDKSYIKWTLSTGEGETEFDMCTVKYTNPKTGKSITGIAKTDEWKKKEKELAEKEAEKEGKDNDDDDKEKDKPEVLVIRNEKVNNVAEANALAEKRLKLANKFERKVTLTLPGNPNYCAGLTIQLKKFGYWTGKYMTSKVKHDITSSGYTTTLTLRRVSKVETSNSAGGIDNPFLGGFLGGNIDIQALIKRLQGQFS